MRTYSAKTPMLLSLWGGGEVEVEAVIDFTVTKFRAASLEGPEEPPMAEVSRFRLRKPRTGEWLTCPAWVEDAFTADNSFLDWLVSDAGDQDAGANEDAADAARDERALRA